MVVVSSSSGSSSSGSDADVDSDPDTVTDQRMLNRLQQHPTLQRMSAADFMWLRTAHRLSPTLCSFIVYVKINQWFILWFYWLEYIIINLWILFTCIDERYAAQLNTTWTNPDPDHCVNIATTGTKKHLHWTWQHSTLCIVWTAANQAKLYHKTWATGSRRY